MAGSIGTAVARVREAGHEMPIEVEAQSLADVRDALEAGADVILLDNLSIAEIQVAVREVGTRAKTEVSGGVTLDRIDEIAATGATYVSVGALTHSAPAVDMSFELRPAEAVARPDEGTGAGP